MKCLELSYVEEKRQAGSFLKEKKASKVLPNYNSSLGFVSSSYRLIQPWRLKAGTIFMYLLTESTVPGMEVL